MQSSNQDLKDEVNQLIRDKNIIICLKRIQNQGKEEQYKDIDWDQKSSDEIKAIAKKLEES